MSVLSLKELSADVPAHATLLDLFEQCREHVVAVATTHLLPNTIAVTTRSGFVQLIDTETGAFRLFLTYLNHIPLDSALRCFSLVPGLVAASARDVKAAQQYLAYSLAYSNELLVAHVESGQVHVLGTHTTRPSAVYCDGDYIACGEGCGQVSVWRISTESRQPQLLWRAALFEDAVVTLRVHRDALICGSADCRCIVCVVDTGVITARLLQEVDQAVCALPLTRPLVHYPVVAICFPRRIAVYRTSASAEHTCQTAGARTASSSPWIYQGGVSLDREVQCACSFGGYLAAGTASGVVLLFACDAVQGSVEELVRFDVGFAVVAVQLYSSERLLVVTSAGDVWCWPLADLLPSPDDVAAEAAEAEQPPEAELVAPRPSAPPAAVGSSFHTDAAAPEPTATTNDADATRTEAEGSAAVERTRDPTTLPALLESLPRLPPENPPAADDAGNNAEMTTMVAAAQTLNVCEAAAKDDDDVTYPVAEDDRTIVMEISMNESVHSDRDEAVLDHTQLKPPVLSAASSTASDADLRAPGSEQMNAEAQSTTDLVNANNEHDGNDGAIVVREDDTTPDALVAFGRKLGLPRAIEGLRRGPRMDPRKVVSVLHAADVRAGEDGPALLDAAASSEGHAPEALQSTQMLEAYRNTILSQHVSEMDVDAYMASHRLEAEALLYRYPVRQPHYRLQDRVFDELAPRRVPAIASGEAPVLSTLDANVLPAPLSAKQRKALANTCDDLVEETYGRVAYKQDPALIAERERGGPVLDAHFCEAVLHVPGAHPTSTVLFNTAEEKWRLPSPVILSLPLPATPSAL